MKILNSRLLNIADADIIDGKFIIPKGIKEIEINAFESCKSLKNINLSNITYIGLWAFDGCTSLRRPNENIRKEIYNNALKYLEKYKNFGLCHSIGYAIYNIGNKYKIALSKECVFPRFTYKNAKKNFKADKDKDDYWFPRKNKKIRKEFLKWCYEDFK